MYITNKDVMTQNGKIGRSTTWMDLWYICLNTGAQTSGYAAAVIRNEADRRGAACVCDEVDGRKEGKRVIGVVGIDYRIDTGWRRTTQT